MCSKLTLWTTVIFCFALFINCDLYASGSKTDQNDSNNNLSKQITLLDTQNTLLKEHNKDLLHTIQWALIFASAFLILFLGMVGYLSHRRYEQYKEILQKSLEGEVTKTRMGLETDFQQKMTTIDPLIKKIAQSVTNATIIPINDTISTLNYSIKILQIEVLTHEVDKWKREEVQGNVLISWFRIAKVSASITHKNLGYRTTEALDNINKLLNQGGKFHDAYFADVVAFLNTLPSEYEPLATSIRNKL